MMSSFLCMMFAYLSSTSPTPSTKLWCAASCSSFFACLYIFPLRDGRTQSWYMVFTHLSSLTATLAFAALMLGNPPSPSVDGRRGPRFATVCLANAAVATAGIFWVGGKVGFYVGEFVMMAELAGWAKEKVRTGKGGAVKRE